MARYQVAHDLDRTWICRLEDGTFYWGSEGSSKGAHLFPNFKAAKAALDSLPDEKRMYGFSYRQRVSFMKSYDSDEHFEREMADRDSRRFLRNAGYL